MNKPSTTLQMALEELELARRRVDELEDRERMLRSVLDRQPVGWACCRVVTDASGRPEAVELLEANPAFERITGLQRAQVVGRNLTEIAAAEAGAELGLLALCREADHAGTQLAAELRLGRKGRRCTVWAAPPVDGYFVACFAGGNDAVAPRWKRKPLLGEVPRG